MDIKAYFTVRAGSINLHLDKLIPQLNHPQSNLYRAARYSLLAEGKRLRPILAIATAESFGAKEEMIINVACTLELLHTYSLIHDDLPCMDNDDYRRGQPTLHRVFPESHAVLAGDFLLTKAFEVIASDRNLSDKTKISLIELLAKNAGGDGMIGGQILDIESENKTIDLNTLQYIHSNKTGAMIAASVQFGAIVADLDEKKSASLRQFGMQIGLAFQIIDDVLDVTQSQELLGKTANSDITNHKCTYVSLLGIERAKAHASELLISAKKILLELNPSSSVLEQITDFIFTRHQ